MEQRVDVERFGGYFLKEVAVIAGLGGSSAQVTLEASGGRGSVVLAVEGLRYLQLDGAAWGDMVDELLALELPQYGSWPEQARHLLHHHNNREPLIWLRLDGPSPIEMLGSNLTVIANQAAADVIG